MQTPPEPNHLKRVLIEYAAAVTDMKVFMYTLLKSDIAIPSETPINSDLTGFKPLTVDRQGVPLIAIFTDKERAHPFTQTHPYLLTVNARWFFSTLPPGTGLTLDPGDPKPFELLPDVIPAILHYYARLAQPSAPKPAPKPTPTPASPVKFLTDPENSLEEALMACREGYITVDTLLACFLRTRIYIASSTSVQPGAQSGGQPGSQALSPLLFDRAGIPMMSVHSSLKRAQEEHPDAPHAMPYLAAAVINSFPPDHGIVLNLGYLEMLEILPQHITQIKQQMAPQIQPG